MRIRKLTKAERDERDAFHARVLANAERTRDLAERAQGKLGAETGSEPAPSPVKVGRETREERDARHARTLANAERTRRLAERAQAELDARSGQ
jgi:hypothetical protein